MGGVFKTSKQRLGGRGVGGALGQIVCPLSGRTKLKLYIPERREPRVRTGGGREGGCWGGAGGRADNPRKRRKHRWDSGLRVGRLTSSHPEVGKGPDELLEAPMGSLCVGRSDSFLWGGGAGGKGGGDGLRVTAVVLSPNL